MDSFLGTPGLKDAKRLRYILNRTAEEGRAGPDSSGPLEDALFEFRAPYGARVIYFYDAERVIVCAYALVKKQNKMPRSAIEEAKAVRKQYFAERKLLND